MSPIRPFKNARTGVYEVNVWRYRMPEPAVGDTIERDGTDCLVTKVTSRPLEPRDLQVFKDARPDLGDYILILEYEYPPRREDEG